MRKVLFFFLFFPLIASAQMREQQTARMLSLGGAGTGSLGLEEAAFQNPASIAFYQRSGFYFQRYNSKTDNEQLNTSEDRASGEAYVLNDTSGPLNGTFSYQRHAEDDSRRRRFTSSFARPLGGGASFGLLYSYTRERLNLSTTADKRTYHHVTAGTTHIVSENFILGATLKDITNNTNNNDSLATLGFQYDYNKIIFLIGDIGANYRMSASENSFWKIGAQLRFFNDLYLRAGRFNSLQENTIGTGWGVAWVGPKLSIQLGFSQSQVYDSTKPSLILGDETLREFILSLSIGV